MLQHLLVRNHAPVRVSESTLINRPPLRYLRRLTAGLAVAGLASSAACTSLSMGGPAFGTASFSSVAPASAPLALRPAAEHTAPAAAKARARGLYAPNIAIGDSLLAATVTRLREESPAFDSAIVAIEHGHVPVVIGTARQLRDQLPPGYRYVSGWQALTAVYPLTPNHDRGKPIDHFSVIVRLKDLRAALRTDATPEDSALFRSYLERVLAHEIYGHLMPQLEYGKTAPIICDDPTSGADWYSACVMQRERHVMTQIAEADGTFNTNAGTVAEAGTNH